MRKREFTEEQKKVLAQISDPIFRKFVEADFTGEFDYPIPVNFVVPKTLNKSAVQTLRQGLRELREKHEREQGK